jgi:hypothetical protein
LWLIVTPPVFDSKGGSARRIIEQRKRFLRLGSDYLETIYTAFVALHRPRWAAELSGDIRSFVEQVDISARLRLERASALVSNLADVWMEASARNSLELAKVIAESALQSLIGHGVDLHFSEGKEEARSLTSRLRALLKRDELKRGALKGDVAGSRISAEIAALCRTLGAITGDFGNKFF